MKTVVTILQKIAKTIILTRSQKTSIDDFLTWKIKGSKGQRKEGFVRDISLEEVTLRVSPFLTLKSDGKGMPTLDPISGWGHLL
jgi:hypothetical protein